MKKRILCILLSLMMLLTMVPLGALPALAEEKTDPVFVNSNADAIAENGGMIPATGEQPLATPTADDFTFILPENCEYDGQPKQASVFTETAIKIELIEDTHGANCQTMGKGHYEAAFATLGTAKTASEFDTTCGDHHYVDYVCEYCGDELFDDAKHDAIIAIHEAAEHSKDPIVILLAETAEDEIEDINTDTVAKVIAIRNRYVSAIEKLTGTIHEHTFSTEYSKNEFAHWYAATCDHDVVTGLAAHTFGEGVVDGNKTTYTCTACGYEKVETEDETAKLLAEALAALEKAKADLDKIMDEKTELEELLKAKEVRLEKLNAQTAAQTAEIASLNQKIEELNGQIADKDAQINAKQATIDSLNAQLDAAKKENERLKGQGGNPATDNTCPKCGRTHADNFIGQITCFIYRIINRFGNLVRSPLKGSRR